MYGAKLSVEQVFRLPLWITGALFWLTLLAPALSFALPSGDYFLHTQSGDTLNTASPTATTAKSKNAPARNRTTFTEVGVWSAGASDTAVKLDTLTALHIWLGLKNSDDQGTFFDVRAEVRKNGTIIASGETKNIQGVTRNPNKAKEVTVTFGTIANGQFAPGDVLSLRILTKTADKGGHKSGGGLLYYDATIRPARFGAMFTPITVGVDLDGDGFTEAQGDCNDANSAVNPGAEELCNSADDNCNGTADEGFLVGSVCTVGVGACERAGIILCATDGNNTVCEGTPGAPTTEVCNNIDDNCDGQVDEGLGTISCGQNGCEQTVAACVNGQPGVCIPGTPKAEICGNGMDEDCNGSDLTCVVTLSELAKVL
jgi:hypothetical protein